jgi:hypothetical protein
MALSCYHTGIRRTRVTTCLLVGLLAGCTAVGPAAIRSGRLTYNEAITTTNNQQMLMVVIHNRYNETASLLAVASVTANVRVATGTAIQLGIGDSDNYAGNLVPFSASAIYEENPTISYTPVEGQEYMSQLMSPVPVADFARLAETITDPAPIYAALVSSLNGIYNPDFLFPSAEPDPRFNRLVAIISELTRAQRLHWVSDPQDSGNVSVVIDRYVPTYADAVDELMHLLELPAPGHASSRLALPVHLAVGAPSTGGINITTRSVFRLVEILSAAVEVPEQDQGNGATTDYPAPGPIGKQLRIRHAKVRPDHAAVAVQYRDGWFYIDDNDRATKQFFRLLGTLWSVVVAESAANSSAAPVLTIPASR